MSASENRKDELAARALSRLSDPPLPDGLAARITARATGTAQLNTVEADSAHPTAPRAIEAAPSGPSENGARRRWRVFAAAAAAAAVIFAIGTLTGMSVRQNGQPALAKNDPTSVPPRSEPGAPDRLADAVPDSVKPDEPSRKALRSVEPAMRLPIPASEDPLELVAESKPAETGVSSPTVADQEELAQTGPQIVPQSGIVSAPVYGPPAPSGLGIAGSTGSSTSFPGEADMGSPNSRGPSSGPPPGGIPGSSTPRGRGSRH